jgi:hypothetical protein
MPVVKTAVQQQWTHVVYPEPPFEVLTTAEVDGVPWYTIACRKEVSMWIRENGVEGSEWYSHIDGRWMIYRNTFDVSQEMFTMTKLRWGHE